MKKDLFGFCAGIRWTDGLYYFSHMDYNGLFSLNLETGKTEFLAFFPEEKKTQCFLHMKCLRYQNSLVFVPEQARHIHIYKPETGELQAVFLEGFQSGQTGCGGAEQILLEENKLMIFPCTLKQPIFEINIAAGLVKKNWDFTNWCRKHINADEEALFGRIVKKGNWIWMAAHSSNQIVGMDLEKENTYQLYSLHDADLYLLFPSETGFWLCQRNHHDIIHWNEKTEELERYSAEWEENGQSYDFNYILETEYGVYALPAQSEKIQRLIPEEKRFYSIYELPEDCRRRDPQRFLFFGLEQKGEELWLYPNCLYQFLVLNMRTNQVKIIPVEDRPYEYSAEPYRSLGKEFVKEPAWEGESFDILDYIEVIAQM